MLPARDQAPRTRGASCFLTHIDALKGVGLYTGGWG